MSPVTNAPVFPNGYQAADYGLLAMNYDPVSTTGASTALNASGTVHVARLAFRRRLRVTSIVMYVQTAGVTLTSGQSFAGIYNAAGTLLSSTADQSTTWNSNTTPTKTMNLSAAQDCPPGYYDIAFFSVGTTRPAFLRTGADGNTNLGLTGTDLRIATADTGRTTSLPATLGTKVTTNAVGYWVAVV